MTHSVRHYVILSPRLTDCAGVHQYAGGRCICPAVSRALTDVPSGRRSKFFEQSCDSCYNHIAVFTVVPRQESGWGERRRNDLSCVQQMCQAVVSVVVLFSRPNVSRPEFWYCGLDFDLEPQNFGLSRSPGQNPGLVLDLEGLVSSIITGV